MMKRMTPMEVRCVVGKETTTRRTTDAIYFSCGLRARIVPPNMISTISAHEKRILLMLFSQSFDEDCV